MRLIVLEGVWGWALSSSCDSEAGKVFCLFCRLCLSGFFGFCLSYSLCLAAGPFCLSGFGRYRFRICYSLPSHL
jgi:hypothetical protein